MSIGFSDGTIHLPTHSEQIDLVGATGILQQSCAVVSLVNRPFWLNIK